MDRSIPETLEYIMFIARHIRPGDVPRAILVILMELNFHTHLDGFQYLRESIFLKSEDPRKRLSAIFAEIILLYESQIDSAQIDQSIRHSIGAAWQARDAKRWEIILPENLWKTSKPANNAFISRIAYLVELWKHCSVNDEQP